MKNIYTSPRFWLIAAIVVLQSLPVFNIITSDQSTQLINIISTALGGIVAVRTVDKIGESKVKAAQVSSTVATVSLPQNVSSVTATKKKSK